MSRRVVVMILILLFLLMLLVDVNAARGAPGAPQPDPAQQRPDVFPCDVCRVDRDGNGVVNLADENPVTRQVKQTRAASYRVAVLPGCNSGTIPSDLVRMNEEAKAVGLTLTRNDTNYQFTVYISCGNDHIRRCGGINVYCLAGSLDGRVSYPYSCDVYLSDVLSNWTINSRINIPLHEIVGHCIGTWNEQYATCGAVCNFAPTPGLVDFMNTGEGSRNPIGFSTSALGRWERTMWSLAPVCTTDPCWDGMFWTFSSGWKVNPATDQWWDPLGRLFWLAADVYGWRFSPVSGEALAGGTQFWRPEFGHLFVP